MGIRIHKILGYGLVDVKSNHGHVLDDRFNDEGWFGLDWAEREKRFPSKGLIDHYKSISEFKPIDHLEISLLLKRTEPIRIDDIITYDSEYGLPNVICFTPFDPHWKRYDDQIDYYEERALNRYGVEPNVDVLTVPLYPYDGYINIETGKRADRFVQEWIYQFRNADIELTKPDAYRAPVIFEEVEKYHNMRNNALEKLECALHWTEKWNVVVPEQIVEFCRYTKMFNDERTIRKLQPMIYTYWS